MVVFICVSSIRMICFVLAWCGFSTLIDCGHFVWQYCC